MDDTPTSAPPPKPPVTPKRDNTGQGMAGEGAASHGGDVERLSDSGDIGGVENLPHTGEDSRDVERPSGEDSGTNVNSAG